MHTLSIRSTQHTQFINIDAMIERVIAKEQIEEGICHLFVPHTTAGITINENADPDVMYDMQQILERVIPWKNGYAHAEGNSAAHVKAGMMGFSQTVPIHQGRLTMGVWQSIYFCEFDGPRNRSLYVQIMPVVSK